MESWLVPIIQLPSRLREIRFCIYPVHVGWYESGQGKRSLEYLDLLVQRAAESVPDARITILNANRVPLAPYCQLVANATIERLQKLKIYRQGSSSDSSCPEGSTAAGQSGDLQTIKL